MAKKKRERTGRGAGTRMPPFSTPAIDGTINDIPSSDLLNKLLQQSQTTSGDDNDIQVTKEEAHKFERAFQDDEFRKLLSEYVSEISDPKHRAEQNEYIRKLEEQNAIPHGKKIIHPNPGFVLKFKFAKASGATSGQNKNVNGSSKADQTSSAPPSFDHKLFVNVVASVEIGQPEPSASKPHQESQGTRWSIPYIVGPLRTEYDKSKQNVVPTCDCCFHPKTLQLVQLNKQFKELVVGIARGGAEKQMKCDFGGGIVIDTNYHVLRGAMYMSNEPGVLLVPEKGTSLRDTKCSGIKEVVKEGSAAFPVEKGTGAKATSLQEPASPTTNETTGSKENQVRVGARMTLSRGFLTSPSKATKMRMRRAAPQSLRDDNFLEATRSNSPSPNSETNESNENSSEDVIPEYTITERGVFELAENDSRAAPTGSPSPKFLVVRICLPNVSSPAQIDLDVSEHRLVLTSLPFIPTGEKKNELHHHEAGRFKYALTCKLPYPIHADQGHADWEMAKHVLTVTLPVQQGISSSGAKESHGLSSRSVDAGSDANCEEENKSPSIVDPNENVPPCAPTCKSERFPTDEAHARWVQNTVVNSAPVVHREPFAIDGEIPTLYNGSVVDAEKETPQTSKHNSCNNFLPTSPSNQQDFNQCLEHEENGSESDNCPSDEFVASGTYIGSFQGFVFRIGDRGLGYYKDNLQDASESVDEGEDDIRISQDDTEPSDLYIHTFQSDLAFRID